MAPRPEPGITLKVRVQPRASRDQVVGYQGDTLRLRVKAVPQHGKANEAVVSLLAETLSVPKNRVQIVRGHSSRDKLVVVESLTPAEAQRRLNSRFNSLNT